MSGICPICDAEISDGALLCGYGWQVEGCPECGGIPPLNPETPAE